MRCYENIDNVPKRSKFFYITNIKIIKFNINLYVY